MPPSRLDVWLSHKSLHNKILDHVLLFNDIMSASEPTSLVDWRVTNIDHELIIIFNLSFEEKVT
jgi:hypothetical protein